MCLLRKRISCTDILRPPDGAMNGDVLRASTAIYTSEEESDIHNIAMSRGKRKVDRENRVFEVKWETQYLFTEIKEFPIPSERLSSRSSLTHQPRTLRLLVSSGTRLYSISLSYHISKF
ncbi:uncharacterized protein V6R79_004980 [Siganus canaliculatus]